MVFFDAVRWQPYTLPTPTPTPTSAPVPTSTPFACSSWDLANDFRISPNEENPNSDLCNNPGVWSFMGSGSLARNPINYYLLPNFTPDSGGYLGLNKYDTNTQFPHINYNAGAEIVVGVITIPANSIDVHPASDQMGIFAWHSPINGYISINGEVSDNSPGCGGGDGIRWYIDKNSINLASGGYDNPGSQMFASGAGGADLNAVAVNAGDMIYLAIGPNGNFFCDDTRVNLSINVTSAPTATPFGATPIPTSTPWPTSTPCEDLWEHWFDSCPQAFNGESDTQVVKASHNVNFVINSIQETILDVQLFYRVRDEVLSLTPEGNDFTDLYYQHGQKL